MISFGSDTRVFVSTAPVDFRKGAHGLVALVADSLKGDPYCGDIFVFRSKRRDCLKILVFDGTGMILATKWLEEGGFAWPPIKGNRCGGSTRLRFPNPIGAYAFLLKRICCQYSRMAATAGAMSRHASRAKARVSAPVRNTSPR